MLPSADVAINRLELLVIIVDLVAYGFSGNSEVSSTKLFHYSVICHKALNIVSDNARALPINNMSALSGGKISLCHNTGFILASAKWQH